MNWSGPFPWPDVTIGAILALLAFKGFARGFVKEVGGLVALAAFAIAPHYYNGVADADIDKYTKLGPVAAHLIGMLLAGVVAYAAVMAVAVIAQRLAKLPVLGLGNSLAGAVVGFLKGAFVVWLALYVALFFPLTIPVRAALHQSRLAPYFVTFNGLIDGAIQATIPVFARPYTDQYFDRHHL